MVLGGALFANAQSERGPHPIDVDTTTLTGRVDGDYMLTGRKFYSTGALFADWVIVRASLADGSGAAPTASHAEGAGVRSARRRRGCRSSTTGTAWVSAPPRRAPSRSTTSRCPPNTSCRSRPIFAEPTVYGAHAQLLHAAIDVGIATGALAEGVRQAAQGPPALRGAGRPRRPRTRR